MTTLAQRWHNVGTTLAQRWHNVGTTLAQRWHNVGTTLAQRWHNVGTTLAQRWHNVGTTLAQCGIGNGEPYVGPTVQITLHQRRQPTLGQRCCLRWANVVVLSGRYLHQQYTIRRSTCLFNDTPISIESNRIVSYLYMYAKKNNIYIFF